MGLEFLSKRQTQTAPSDGTGALSHIMRGAGSLYVGTLVQLAGRLLFAVLVARWVGAEAVGVFAIGLVAIQTLVMVATAGVEVGLYHFVSPAVKNNDWVTVKGMFWASVLTTGGVGILLALVYVLLIPFYPLGQLSGSQAGSVLQLLAPALFFQVVVVILGAFGLALGSPTIRVVAERLVGTTTQLVALGVLLFLGMGVAGAMLAYVGGMLCALGVAIYFTWRLYPHTGHVPPIWSYVKRLYLYSYKQGLARIVGYVLMNANLLVLGYLASASQVGIYAAASRLTLVGLLFLEAFAQMFASLAANKQREAFFQDDFQRVTKWTVLFSTPLFILLAAFAPAWMMLMGTEFVAGAPVLVVLAMSQFISMFTGSSGFLLAVRGRPDLTLLNSVLGWGTGAVLTVLLAGSYGALGAAVAFFVAIIVFVVLEIFEVRTVFGFYPVGRSILPTVGLLGIFGALAFGIGALTTVSLFSAVIWSALLLPMYAVAAWRFTLQPVDILVFKEIGQRFGTR